MKFSIAAPISSMFHSVLRAAAAAMMFAAGAAAADDAATIRELLARGDARAALPLAQQMLAANPRDAQVRFQHGVVLMALERDAEAFDAFTALSQMYPELPDPLNNLALLHARAGRLDASLQALQGALRNDPAHRIARENLGHVHLMLAARAWEQAAAAGPLDAPLLRKLHAVQALLASR